MLRLSRARFTLCLGLVAASCATPDPIPYLEQAQYEKRMRGGPPEVETPGVQRGKTAEGGALRREVLYLPDGSVVRHGTERILHPDGSVRSVREYDRGEPTGSWRVWYEDGTPRMSHDYGPERSPMVFYHPNGLIEASGDAANGERVGEWTFYDENGAVLRTTTY